jgi:branched-chain amino acid transport system permease protein
MEQLLQFLILPVTLFGIEAIRAMSLQLVLGGAGLLSLGHAAYFAVGGYFSGIFAVFIAPALGITDPNLMLLGGLIFGALSAGFTGFLVAIPCLRLQGDYLAMATLGFGEIVATVFKNVEAVGGTRGFKDIPKLGSIGMIWLFVGLVFIFLKLFYRTGVGFSILATRDDEIAARSVGIPSFRTKVIAFSVGCGLAGIAGSFFVHTLQFISPEEASFIRSVEVVLAVVIGGMYSLPGSILGAFILTAIPEAMRFAPDAIKDNRMMFFALIVIILMIVNPKGLANLKNFRRGKAAIAKG